jgi:hypothetical protein
MLNKQADPSFIDVTRKLFTGYSKIVFVILIFVFVNAAHNGYVEARDDIQESTTRLIKYTKESEEERSALTNEVIDIDTNRINVGYYEYVIEVLLPAFIIPTVPILYIWMLHNLFYIPLSRHKDWVVANGIFATTEAKEKVPRTTPLISLPNFSIKTSSSLSVADELVKLNKLKEAGLVTQDEFDKLRKALLN